MAGDTVQQTGVVAGLKYSWSALALRGFRAPVCVFANQPGERSLVGHPNPWF